MRSTVIPNFTDIYWWEGYANVDLTKYDIVVAYGNINSVFCEYNLVVTENKINI